MRINSHKSQGTQRHTHTTPVSAMCWSRCFKSDTPPHKKGSSMVPTHPAQRLKTQRPWRCFCSSKQFLTCCTCPNSRHCTAWSILRYSCPRQFRDPSRVFRLPLSSAPPSAYTWELHSKPQTDCWPLILDSSLALTCHAESPTDGESCRCAHVRSFHACLLLLTCFDVLTRANGIMSEVAHPKL
jgi:hypothetical protein